MTTEPLLTCVRNYKEMIAKYMDKANVFSMNALTTLEKINIHAQPVKSHIAFNPMDNSTQDNAVTMRHNKSSVSQLLIMTPKIEIFFFLASSRTLKTSAHLMNSADGKEKRLNATTLQDGLPSKVFNAPSSLEDTAPMVMSKASNMLHLNSTTQPKTAALVVNKLLKRIHFQLFQLIHRLSTTNVLTNQRMKETGESLSTANRSETTS
jgi:hypothetical protein